MTDHRPSTSGFEKAFGETKKQATGLANAVSDAAQDVYGQAAESSSRVASTAQNAVRKSAGSFEKAVHDTIENQPYTAVFIALGIGWLLGRLHRPL
jgi:ElaB/YqjD/DUF883 family membrane-anchored ribosome-binding protein